VLIVQSQQENDSNNRRHAHRRDDETPPPHRPNQIRCGKSTHDAHRTTRHLNNRRPCIRISKRLDNNAGEIGDGAVVDHGKQRDEEERPGGFVGEQEFADLVPFEGFVLDAGLVDADVVDGGGALGGDQEGGGHGVVGEEEDGEEADNDGEDALGRWLVLVENEMVY